MQAQPELFDAYHEGFRAQTRTWASNPVDLALRWIRSKAKLKVVADFGCGDAQLAQELAGDAHGAFVRSGGAQRARGGVYAERRSVRDRRAAAARSVMLHILPRREPVSL